MKKASTIALVLWSYMNLGYAQTPADDPHWYLYWQDEFTTLNTSNWEVKDNFDHYGGMVVVYIDDNVYVQNGELVIEVKEESYSCPGWAIEPNYHCVGQYNSGSPYSYTSGNVQSATPNIHYGYFEAKIKVPDGHGFWPAFWTFVNTTTNGTQELDMFEMLPGHTHDPQSGIIHDENVASSNWHLSQTTGGGFSTAVATIVDDYTQWHTWGVEWNSERIIYYVDGQPYRIFDNEGFFDPTKLIFNIALNPWIQPQQWSSSDFPSTMNIDYVRYYRPHLDCNTNLYACNYDFSNHDNKVKKNIVISSGCSNSLSVGDDVHLRSNTGVDIVGDFYVPIGAELFLDGTPCPASKPGRL